MRNIHRLLFLCAFLAACGGVSPPAGDDSGTPPDASIDTPPPPPTCTADGAACDLDGVSGVCAGNTCSSCDSDAACQSAYGGTYACIDGACQVPPPPNGCNNDAQCDAGQVCQNGSCVAQSGCQVGGDIECCANSDCTTSGDTCQAHQCVPTSSGCTAPASAVYYVDPTYSGPHTGSQMCPFKTLHGAFNEIRNDAFTGDSEVRIVDGATIDPTTEGAANFPLAVPASTWVHGPTTATTYPTIVAPPNTSAFVAKYAIQQSATHQIHISYLDIKQASPGTAGTAVDVTAGSSMYAVRLGHLNIHNFFNGIHVEGGYTNVVAGVNAHGNAQAGLFVDGGRADVSVAADADARTHFDSNVYGIWVTADPASALTIEGTIRTADGLESVTASSNSQQGIHIGSPNAVNSISHVGVLSNGKSGVVIYGGTTVKVRNLNIQMSGADGIHILDNGTATSLSGIDLGKAGDPGKNSIQSSTDSHVCVTTTRDATTLSAEGNIYGQLDCSTTAGAVNMWNTCAGHGRGFNDTSGYGRDDVLSCTISVQP